MKVTAMVERAAELGQSAIALTDHGWMAGSVKLVVACRKHEITPIMGAEVYVATQEDAHEKANGPGDMYHLTLLCQNRTGYMNLVRLTSDASKWGFFHKPRIDLNQLEKYSDGIIMLSGCIGAELPQRIVHQRPVKKLIERYLRVFGDRFFIELMVHGATGGIDHVRIDNDDGEILMEEHELNDELVHIARRYSIPIVATNDAHYLGRENGEGQDSIMCMNTGSYKAEPNRLKFPGVEHGEFEFFIKSEEEMRAVSNADWWDEACRTSAVIAATVDPDALPLSDEIILPDFKVPINDPGFKIWLRTGMIL